MIEGIVKYSEFELARFAEQKKRHRKNNNEQKKWNFRVLKIKRKLDFMATTRQEKILIKILKADGADEDHIKYMLRLRNYLEQPLAVECSTA